MAMSGPPLGASPNQFPDIWVPYVPAAESQVIPPAPPPDRFSKVFPRIVQPWPGLRMPAVVRSANWQPCTMLPLLYELPDARPVMPQAAPSKLQPSIVPVLALSSATHAAALAGLELGNRQFSTLKRAGAEGETLRRLPLFPG